MCRHCICGHWWILLVSGYAVEAGRSCKEKKPVKRAHVLLVEARLILPTKDGDLTRITFGLINRGNSDATFISKDRTYMLTDNPEEKVFKYLPAAPEEIPVPAIADAITLGDMRFKMPMSPEILAALNTGKARLFFFAHGEYREADGRVYPHPFSAMYDLLSVTKLIACPNDVTFK